MCVQGQTFPDSLLMVHPPPGMAGYLRICFPRDLSPPPTIIQGVKDANVLCPAGVKCHVLGVAMQSTTRKSWPNLAGGRVYTIRQYCIGTCVRLF